MCRLIRFVFLDYSAQILVFTFSFSFCYRNSHKEHEEWSRLLDRRDVELNSLKENNQNLSHRLGAAEAKVSAIENELHIANATLIERTNQLSTIQRELDQRRNNQDNMDESFRKDKVGINASYDIPLYFLSFFG